MRHEDSNNRPFPTTRWSLIGRAGGDSAAMDVLLRRYLPALRAYLMLELKVSAPEADELLQEFTADKILGQHLLSHADRDRGRFRTFLLASLRNFLADRARADAAKKRQPMNSRVVHWDEQVGQLPSENSSCDGFDVEWARQTLAEAVTRMRDETDSCGRADLWEIFRARILDPCITSSEPMPYDKLVERFGFRSAAQASNTLVTVKRMFARCLRAVIAEYANESKIDSEIAELRRILASPQARAKAAAGTELMEPETS